MPKGYWIVRVDVHDAESYKDYVAANGAAFAKYGGRFLVRGGKAHVLEGDWPEKRRVVIEFPTVEAARKWWDSPEYEKPKALRRANSKGRLLLLEGAA